MHKPCLGHARKDQVKRERMPILTDIMCSHKKSLSTESLMNTKNLYLKLCKLEVWGYEPACLDPGAGCLPSL